jgi:chorismate mutase
MLNPKVRERSETTITRRKTAMSSNGHSNSSSQGGQWHPIACRGIRGATTVEENTAEVIISATYELLAFMVELNQVHEADIAGVIFTTTPDLDAQFPAKAARQLGWHLAPLIGAQEMNVTQGLPRCVRILIFWNTSKLSEEIQHVYLREAQKLRPDRATTFPELLNELAQRIQA